MICKECGAVNEEGSKYCTACGDLIGKEGLTNNKGNLEVHNSSSNSDKCRQCGFGNSPEDNYCIECGSPLRQKNQSNHKQPKNMYEKCHNASKLKTVGRRNEKKISNWKMLRAMSSMRTLWITLCVVLGSIVLAIVIDLSARASSGGETESAVPEVKSKNPVVESGVVSIASKFICNCGDCDAESLELCKCVYAVEERKMIRDFLEQSVPEETIIAKIEKNMVA